MANALQCTSRSLAKRKIKGEKMSDEKKTAVYNKMVSLSKDWFDGPRFKNVKDGRYNTMEQFERLYEEATGLHMDPVASAIPHLKDLRKFEIKLESFNTMLTHKDGAILSNLMLPRRVLQRLPELKLFADELVKETGFFRRENVDNNKRVYAILENFKKFSGAIAGSDPQLYSKIEASLEPLIANKRAGKDYDRNKYSALRNEKMRTLLNGAGKANMILSEVFQGASIADLRKKHNFGSHEETLLNNMKSEWNEIRKATSVNLVRAIQKLMNIHKDSNVPGMDRIMLDLKNRIKEIEFQQLVDAKGDPIHNLDFFNADAEMQAFGFTSGSRYAVKEGKTYKVANRQYMPQYVLGLPKLLSKVERVLRKEVEGADLEKLTREIDREVTKLDGILDHAKGRTIADSEYSLDPFLFLNRYVSEVSLFNYKIHVKDSFKRAYDTLMNEHMKPAKQANNEPLQDALEHHLRVATDVYNTVQQLDPSDTTVSDNLMRSLSALTYFRLLGGNLRSAFRNGTQRIYELDKWGFRGLKEAKQFYTEEGGTENIALADAQAKRFGLLWFDGKQIGSKLIDSLKGGGDISSASRGALQESFFTGKGLRVNSEGEIVRSEDGVTDIVARFTSKISDKAAFAHKVVEDWNRSRTFRTGFAIALRNIKGMSSEWRARKSGINPETDPGGKKMARWMANEAGQISYNTVLDIHYEYSNWAKAKVLQSGKGAKRKLGQFLGQFMHYRFSNFDMMANWAKDAGISIRSGDFTSQEIFVMMRLGIVQGIINNIFAPAVNVRTDSVLNNDVAETADAAYSWFATDRNDPEAVKKLDKKTYGQGGWYFLGPNVGWLLSLAEVKNFREMDKDSHYRDDIEYVDDRNKQYKMISLINSQLARSWTYSIPLFYQRGIIDSIRMDLGLFPDQDIRDIRDSAKKWIGRKVYPQFKLDWLKYKPKKEGNQKLEDALQSLSLLS